MEAALGNSEQGRKRLRQAEEKMTVAVARQIQEQESNSKRGSYQEGGSSGSNKRSRDEGDVADANVSKAPKVDNEPGSSVIVDGGVNVDRDVEGDVTMDVVDMPARGRSPPEFIGEVSSNMDNKFIKVSLVYVSISSRHAANVCAVENGLVTELYSPLRVGKFVARYGTRSGHAIDIKT